jgi:hypothetical protein
MFLATPWSRPPCLTAFFIMRSISRSRGKLSTSRTCRPRARDHPVEKSHPTSADPADSQTPGSAAKKRRNRSARWLITSPAKLGNFTLPKLGNFRAPLTPFGAPGDIPPCGRQRPFGIAGDRYRLPLLVRARQRGRMTRASRPAAAQQQTLCPGCVCREAESERSYDEVRRGPHVI